ncbi:histidine--tRNA ligase [Mycoplasma sp. 1012]
MYIKPKGTKDIYDKEVFLLQKIQETFFNIIKNWNFKYIETPIFEYSNLFIRTSGETSDIVNKEMYLFKDKSDRELALRPEGTASTVRAILENKLYINNNKFAYFGPMFRYERPQKGRFRQFYQAGIEYISQSNYLYDFEIISFATRFLELLKIKEVKLKINCLGSREDRKKYLVELKKYLITHQDELEKESIIRLEKNPLRILDDKIEQTKTFIKQAPKILDFINEKSKNEFNKLQELMQKQNIDFEVDEFLVRGLDYYDDFVFEFESSSKALGSKSTLIGGGRYNNLFWELNGPQMSAIGLGIGVERIIEILDFNNDFNYNSGIDIYVASFNEDEFNINNKLILELRKHNFKVESNKEIQKIAKIFAKAENIKAKYILFKEKNQKNTELTLKNLSTNEKKILQIIDIKAFIKEIHNEIN